jgi:hypothetical protein
VGKHPYYGGSGARLPAAGQSSDPEAPERGDRCPDSLTHPFKQSRLSLPVFRFAADFPATNGRRSQDREKPIERTERDEPLWSCCRQG